MPGLIPYRRRRMHRRIEPLYHSLLEGFFGEDPFDLLPVAFRDTFRTDIQETDKEYILEAELPGFKKEDIQIGYSGDTLTIAAEQKGELNTEGDNFIRRERRYGKVQRSFRVENIDPDQIQASYNDGILKIVLPKRQDGTPRKQISIQ